MFLGFGLMLYSLFTHPIYGGIDFIKSNTPDYAFKIPGNFNWTFVFVWGFIALITFIDPGFYQRSFAGNSLKTVKKGILISIIFWIIFDFMTVFTGIYASAILTGVETSPYLDLADKILSPIAKGFFIVSLMAIVMSTIDSFSFISAITIGKDLPEILYKKSLEGKHVINLTRIGLFITAFISIIISLNFSNAIDIWYMVGSFAVPALLIPMVSLFYGVRFRHPVMLMLIPVLATSIWFLLGMFNKDSFGYPQYILHLDPMYPGLFMSCILFFIFRRR